MRKMSAGTKSKTYDMLLIEHCNKMQAQVMMITPEGHAETLQQGKSESGNEGIL